MKLQIGVVNEKSESGGGKERAGKGKKLSLTKEKKRGATLASTKAPARDNLGGQAKRGGEEKGNSPGGRGKEAYSSF